MVWSLKEPKASDSNSLSSLIWALESKIGHHKAHFGILNQEQLQVISDFIAFVNNYMY